MWSVSAACPAVLKPQMSQEKELAGGIGWIFIMCVLIVLLRFAVKLQWSHLISLILLLGGCFTEVSGPVCALSGKLSLDLASGVQESGVCVSSEGGGAEVASCADFIW